MQTGQWPDTDTTRCHCHGNMTSMNHRTPLPPEPHPSALCPSLSPSYPLTLPPLPPRGDNLVAIDLITEHIRTKLQQHYLRRIYPNLEVIPSNYQVRGMHTIIRDAATSKSDYVFYADRLNRLVGGTVQLLALLALLALLGPSALAGVLCAAPWLQAALLCARLIPLHASRCFRLPATPLPHTSIPQSLLSMRVSGKVPICQPPPPLHPPRWWRLA
jgi:hypothetical protein